VNLLVDGEVVRTATGKDSEALDWASWDVRDLEGREARIQIVDRNSGGWGHILADQIMFADAPAESSVQRASWLDYGKDYYAAVSWNDAPGGKRLMIGWMNNWQYAASTPSQGWRSAMSLVREVRLERHAGRTVLVQSPVDPFAASGTELFASDPGRLAGPTHLEEGVRWLPPVACGDVLRINAEFRPGVSGTVGLVLRAGDVDGVQERTVLAYSSPSGELSLDRTASGNVGFHPDFPSVERVPVRLQDGVLRLSVFLDRCSVEVFAQDGLVTLTDQIFPAESSTAVGLLAEGDGGTLLNLTVTG